jgi:Flp pilus assembly pilin Flp
VITHCRCPLGHRTWVNDVPGGGSGACTGIGSPSSRPAAITSRMTHESELFDTLSRVYQRYIDRRNKSKYPGAGNRFSDPRSTTEAGPREDLLNYESVNLTSSTARSRITSSSQGQSLWSDSQSPDQARPPAFKAPAVQENSYGGISMTDFISRLWADDQGQDIAEYAVMLAVILVIVVGTIRLIGSNANTVFSSAASSIQ